MPQPTASSVADRARAMHQAFFGVLPSHIAQAPGTWCVLGEQTDDFGGIVVLSRLDIATAVVLSPRDPGDTHQGTPGTPDTPAIHLRGSFPGIELPELSSDIHGARSAQSFKDPQESESSTPQYLIRRAALLISTLIQRQMLSRDTPGFNITVCSDIPLESGLGALHSFDAALGLALYPEAHSLDDPPARARLAAVCSHVASAFPDSSPLRARHTAALRSTSGSICVVDYADGSVTTTPALLEADTVAFAVGNTDLPRTHSDEPTVTMRANLINQASHAFGAEHLRSLPHATPRVLDWLKAVHDVHGPQGYPTVEEAATWLAFWEEETQRSRTLVSLLRGRRRSEVASLLQESATALSTTYSPHTDELVALCRSHGAYSARPACVTSSGWVTALVPAAKATAFQEALEEAEYSVIALLPGEVAQAQ
ncbi:galactokinase family protein [Corynebacterium lowii]|uniref:Galactokinase n=1 Tax=Corynebacterium lowii TaxID=1544413 RepID=A0A0Q1E2L5_9CORY|nr:galactokinase family protein [Corynebacterium lowii]KQB86827.1 Galactokinase [Corynebacterium lowii]MDP9851515.1 galactokinase [Corynebacterium lowii]